MSSAKVFGVGFVWRTAAHGNGRKRRKIRSKLMEGRLRSYACVTLSLSLSLRLCRAQLHA